MASQFQNRLVGTIILVAIAVIVLPDIFDGEKKQYKEEVASIPIKPETIITDDLTTQKPLEIQSFSASNEEEEAELVESQEINPDPTEETIEIVKETQTSTSNSSTAIESTENTPSFNSSGWIIQLMSLKNKENATKLVDDLKKRGYVASAQESSNGWIRIIVGPDISKQKLEKQLKELEEITDTTGQLKVYNPTNP